MTPDELHAARHALQLTQAGLAAALGLARNTIVRYETGRWTIPTAIALAVHALRAERALLTVLTGGTPARKTESPRTGRTTRPTRPPAESL
jgi:DNA-binding XRE family transcriptional regulator